MRSVGAIIGNKIVCLICGGKGIIQPPHVWAGKVDKCPRCYGAGWFYLNKPSEETKGKEPA